MTPLSREEALRVARSIVDYLISFQRRFLFVHAFQMHCPNIESDNFFGEFWETAIADLLLRELGTEPSQPEPPCQHERCNEDGCCLACGEDCRGAH